MTQLMPEFSRKSIVIVALLLLPMFAGGCMHYSKGHGGVPLEFDKIYVAVAKNDSFAPQVCELLTRQVRLKLANQYGLNVVKSAENATILETTVVEFQQFVATTRANDTVAAKSFDVKMSVRCTLRNGVTGKIYFSDHLFSDSVACHSPGDYQQTKYQVMPRLTEKIADQICRAVCNPW
jgi:hypothetical protein